MRSEGSSYLPKIWIYLTKNPFPRSSCPSIKRSKQTNWTTQAAPCYVKKGLKNITRPCALARHQRSGALAQRKTRGHHHAGPSQPRRRCSLLPTTKPAPRPPTRVTARGHVLRDCAAAPPCTELRAENRRHRHAQQRQRRSRHH